MNNKKAQKLINLLNINKELYELIEYKITEHSNNNGDVTYKVHNLDAEIEDGEIYFADIDEKIQSNRYSMMGFLIKSIKDIIFEKDLITILFSSQSIIIETIG